VIPYDKWSHERIRGIAHYALYKSTYTLLCFTLQAAATNHDDNSKDGHWATKQTIGYY